MTKFCGACGAQLNGTEAFCGTCGARTAPADATIQQQAVPPLQPVQPIPVQPIPVQPTPVQPTQYVPVAPVQALPPVQPAKSSPILKIILVLVILLALGAALVLGGIFYAAHRASQKIHELARESASGSSLFSDSTLDNPCSFLTKDEVSQATGVTIVRVRPRSTGCAYIAEGDPQEMISKHLAMTNGTEGLTGTNGATGGAPQDVEVFSYSVLGGAVQKALVGKIFDNLGPTSQSVAGVGDQAVVVGGGMMMVRKGDKTVQIVYMRCPCNTDAVKPLAQKLVSAL